MHYEILANIAYVYTEISPKKRFRILEESNLITERNFQQLFKASDGISNPQNPFSV